MRSLRRASVRSLTIVFICLAASETKLSDKKDAAGLSLRTSSLRRPAPDVLDPRVKSLNYLNNVLAKREATLSGVDDALVLNASGLVAEASATNIFALTGRRLVTPPPTDGALEGITRRTILEIASDLGFETSESSLGRFDLYCADAVFLTGTRTGIVPVSSLDGSPVSQALFAIRLSRSAAGTRATSAPVRGWISG